ncbi:MAG: HNH endonuclease signature motif containing protein [candidate division KSB1 bacterium]
MGTTKISPSVRRLVQDRAQGCCEYCLTPEMALLCPYEIDHIISQKHGGATSPENLAFCCVRCNKHKGSDITSIDPQTEEIVRLFHPRRDHWAVHFQLREVEIFPLTAAGRATVRMLQMNHPDRLEEREVLIAGGLYSTPAPTL